MQRCVAALPPIGRASRGIPTQATIALLKDGTIAVEVTTALTLVQWPFLTDISLAWAAASIFDPTSVDASEDASAAAASR